MKRFRIQTSSSIPGDARQIKLLIDIITIFRNGDVNIGEIFEIEVAQKHIEDFYTSVYKMLIIDRDTDYAIIRNHDLGYTNSFEEILTFDKEKNELINHRTMYIGGERKSKNAVDKIYELGFTSREEEKFRSASNLKNELRNMIYDYMKSEDYQNHLFLDYKRNEEREDKDLLAEDFEKMTEAEIDEYVDKHRMKITDIVEEYFEETENINIEKFIEKKIKENIEKNFIDWNIKSKRITKENLAAISEELKSLFNPFTSELIKDIRKTYKEYSLLTNNSQVRKYLVERKTRTMKIRKLYRLIKNQLIDYKTIKILDAPNNKYSVSSINCEDIYFRLDLKNIIKILKNQKADNSNLEIPFRIVFKEAREYSRYMDCEYSRIVIDEKDYSILENFTYRNKPIFNIDKIEEELNKGEEG